MRFSFAGPMLDLLPLEIIPVVLNIYTPPGQKLRSFQDILLRLHSVLGTKHGNVGIGNDAFPRISVGRLRIPPEPSESGNDRFHWLLHRLLTGASL